MDYVSKFVQLVPSRSFWIVDSKLAYMPCIMVVWILRVNIVFWFITYIRFNSNYNYRWIAY